MRKLSAVNSAESSQGSDVTEALSGCDLAEPELSSCGVAVCDFREEVVAMSGFFLMIAAV